MKKRKLIFAALLTAIIIPLTGCDKISEDQKPFIGKWKLIAIADKRTNPEVPPGYEEPSHDYSENNIIYQFKKNGELVITSDIENIAGLQPGKYSYKVRPESTIELSLYFIFIDNEACAYSISASELSLWHGDEEKTWRSDLIRIE